MPQAVRVGAEHAAGWHARLDLRFEARAGRSVLAARHHTGPLAVQRPFWPEGPDGACHVYLLHPPGGVVGGDVLEMNVTAGAGAHALLTTPAAGKLYRSAGPQSVVRQRLRVAAGASLEWLPQPTIAFAGVHGLTDTEVSLAVGGRFIGWEVLCLGRPQSGERYAGTLGTRLAIRQHGTPLWVERMHYDATTPDAPWALRGHTVTGTLLAAPVADAGALDAVRAALACHPQALTGATLVDGVLAVRGLGHQAEPVQRALIAAWSVLRPALLGCPAHPPRVWNT